MAGDQLVFLSRSGDSVFDHLRHNVWVLEPLLREHQDNIPPEVTQQLWPEEVALQHVVVLVVVLRVDDDAQAIATLAGRADGKIAAENRIAQRLDRLRSRAAVTATPAPATK